MAVEAVPLDQLDADAVKKVRLKPAPKRTFVLFQHRPTQMTQTSTRRKRRSVDVSHGAKTLLHDEHVESVVVGGKMGGRAQLSE